MARVSAGLFLVALVVPSALAMRMDKRAAKSTSTVKFAAENSGKPKLCDETIVQDTCFILNGGDQHGDEDNWVSSGLLRETLSANEDTISSLWGDLGLPTEKSTKDGGFWVDCKTLCSQTVSYIPQVGTLPPSSDVACYNIGQKTFCDLDVSPDQLRDLGPGPDEDLPNFQDKKFLAKKTAFMLAQLQANGTADAPSALMQSSGAQDVEYGPWEIVERVANFFRIYPAEKPVASSLVERVARGAVSVAAAHQDWTSAEERLNKQKESLSKAYMSSTIRAFNGKQTRTQMTTWFGSSAYGSSSTRREVLRVLNSVDHMISNVEYVYPGPECEWGVYAYVYPTAYTCSTSSQLKNNACTKYQGRFVFYLCPFYFSRESEMVETLVHEGSHHATAYTDDVDFNGGTAYGRSVCKQLARVNPSLALKNADNFCYYIQDVGQR